MALFVLVRKTTPDKVLEGLKPFARGRFPNLLSKDDGGPTCRAQRLK
jgi:uncharacterized membrane protein